MSQVRIGTHEVVHSCSVILPAGEPEALLSFDLENASFKLKVRFIAAQDQPQATIAAAAEGDVLVVTFSNWNSPLGIASTEPTRISITPSGRTLSFMVAHWAIGGTRKLDLQFMAA